MHLKDLKKLFPYKVAYEPFSSRDAYGKITLGNQVFYDALVVHRSQRIVSERQETRGADIVAAGYVILLALPSSLSVDDRITLPDGAQPLVQRWDRIPSADGDLCVRAYFGAV